MAWMKNYIPLFYMNVITYPCSNLSYYILIKDKGGPWPKVICTYPPWIVNDTLSTQSLFECIIDLYGLYFSINMCDTTLFHMSSTIATIVTYSKHKIKTHANLLTLSNIVLTDVDKTARHKGVCYQCGLPCDANLCKCIPNKTCLLPEKVKLYR